MSELVHQKVLTFLGGSPSLISVTSTVASFRLEKSILFMIFSFVSFKAYRCRTIEGLTEVKVLISTKGYSEKYNSRFISNI